MAEHAREITADRLAVRRALLNLLDNAIQDGPEGSCVSVRTGRPGRAVFAEIADEGPGIAPEHPARIFERFRRIDPSRSREMGGTGLGLALVRWTVEAHGGRAELGSGEGRGSTFRILLPATGTSGRA